MDHKVYTQSNIAPKGQQTVSHLQKKNPTAFFFFFFNFLTVCLKGRSKVQPLHPEDVHLLSHASQILISSVPYQHKLWEVTEPSEPKKCIFVEKY